MMSNASGYTTKTQTHRTSRVRISGGIPLSPNVSAYAVTKPMIHTSGPAADKRMRYMPAKMTPAIAGTRNAGSARVSE